MPKCLECGTVFPWMRKPGPGRNPTCCSPRCRVIRVKRLGYRKVGRDLNESGTLVDSRSQARRKYHICIKCGVTFWPGRRSIAKRCMVCAPTQAIVCAVCGQPVPLATGSRPRQFCSERCRQKQRSARYAHRPGLTKPCPRCKTTRIAFSRSCCTTCQHDPVRRMVPRTPCPDCGRLRTPEHCRLCKTRVWWQKHERPKRVAMVERPRICGECGETFIKKYGMRGTHRYCSTRCGRKHNARIARVTRRARQRQIPRESINPRVVYVRDGWRCQLCHRIVDRRLPPTHPRSASLDHIIPLKLGGTHEYRNVQTAHRNCNTEKGIRGRDQLRLLG
jgi:hypothetical protein